MKIKKWNIRYKCWEPEEKFFKKDNQTEEILKTREISDKFEEYLKNGNINEFWKDIKSR